MTGNKMGVFYQDLEGKCQELQLLDLSKIHRSLANLREHYYEWGSKNLKLLASGMCKRVARRLELTKKNVVVNGRKMNTNN